MSESSKISDPVYRLLEGPSLISLDTIMARNIVKIGMDTTVQDAVNLCAERRIRHLPVVDESGRLRGILTDKNLWQHMSPRIGTISENNSDRETMRRHAHVIMVRDVTTGTPETSLAEGAKLMLKERIGCLPIVDDERRVVGIVTTTDILRLVSEC